MIESVNVIGARGRVGSAVAARLAERGVSLRERDAELILLCVPDRVIVEVASTIAPGPWVAHVSGGTPLAALDPHGRRFSLHPLQTFTHDRGPEQLDGAWAAVTGETEEARAVANELAVLLGVRPFPLADDLRALYHAGAVIASNYLVTLRGMAGELLAEAAVPPRVARPAHAPCDRQRLPVDGPDRARRLGDRRAAPSRRRRDRTAPPRRLRRAGAPHRT